MIGFLIKKTFYDLWDNLLKIALINVGFIVSLAVPVFLPRFCESLPVLQLVILAVGIVWCAVYLSAAALSLTAVSDYGSFSFGDFFKNIKTGLPAGLLIGVMVFLLGFFPAVQVSINEEVHELRGMLFIIMNYYLDMGFPIGYLLFAVIGWTFVIAFLSLQFFFQIRARLDTKLSKVFKKCFIIFFDNPGFCIFSFLHNIVISVFSLILYLFLGPGAILLYLDEAMRLRLLKYDWLEANPVDQGSRPKRRKIPWDAILIDEREKTGSRSLRNLIFPWKD